MGEGRGERRADSMVEKCNQRHFCGKNEYWIFVCGAAMGFRVYSCLVTNVLTVGNGYDVLRVEEVGS